MLLNKYTQLKIHYSQDFGHSVTFSAICDDTFYFISVLTFAVSNCQLLYYDISLQRACIMSSYNSCLVFFLDVTILHFYFFTVFSIIYSVIFLRVIIVLSFIRRHTSHSIITLSTNSKSIRKFQTCSVIFLFTISESFYEFSYTQLRFGGCSTFIFGNTQSMFFLWLNDLIDFS